MWTSLQGQRPPLFPPQVVRPRFPTQAVRGQPNYPGAMMTRPRVQRAASARPVGHNQQQARMGPAGGMPGMQGRMGGVPSSGPRNTKYRPPVNQTGAGQTAPANATTSPGIAMPVSDCECFSDCRSFITL